MDDTYRIVRFHFNAESEVIATGLTLDEAQDHCNDPETSSSTASEETLDAIGHGQWFDGYNAE